MKICINKSLWEELNIQYCIATLTDRNPIAHSNVLLSVNSLYNKQALMPWFTGETQHSAVVIQTNVEVSDPCPLERFCGPVAKAVFFLIGAIPLCCNIVTIYYVNNTTYINQKLLKVKILATRFSYNEPSSGQKRKIVLVHSVIAHSMGSHIVYISYYRSHVGWKPTCDL